MNPFPWRPCGLASDTRRALPVKIPVKHLLRRSGLHTCGRDAGFGAKGAVSVSVRPLLHAANELKGAPQAALAAKDATSLQCIRSVTT
jgi:hypothetical protein